MRDTKKIIPDGFESKFLPGDRVKSIATWFKYDAEGTVIELKRPKYIFAGVLKIPMLVKVKFDDGDTAVCDPRYIWHSDRTR